MSRWRSRIRPWVAGVAVLVVAGGCVEPDPPGVGIQKLAADIVFGVKPLDPDTPPANLSPGRFEGDAVTFVTPSGGGSGSPASPATGARPARPPSNRLPRPTPLTPPRLPCPPAALTAFPAQEAGLNVAAPPVEGQYRWKRQGTQTLTGPPAFTLPIAGFEQRLVRNIQKISDTEFTFETVQPELGGEVTTITTFKVKTAAQSRTVAPPITEFPNLPVDPPRLPVDPPELPVELPEPSPPGAVTAGDPERGISVMRIERVDAAGNSSVLNFSPAVLYLPLPVQAGEQFSSVGIDPRTGQVLQHQARVLNRERVDACGEVVDGWAVEATQTFSGSGTATRGYRYIVAPQLGGFIISEEFHVTSPQGTTDLVVSLAQLRPSPLPAQSQGG